MLRKIIAFALLGIMVGCGTHKSQIQTTKNGVVKNKTPRNTKTPPRHNGSTASNNTKKDTRTTEVLESTSRTVVYSEQVKEYVQTYKGIAQDNMKRHGVPASITLAQGILESGAGRGTLCVEANNHFGIKCHEDWTGDKVYHDDDSAQECFRKYNKASESFDDHSVFLTSRGRYAGLFKLDKDDYEGWAKGLRSAGYATDPKYPDKLIGLIERFELSKYDEEVLGKKYTPKTIEEPTVKSENTPAIVEKTVTKEVITPTVEKTVTQTTTEVIPTPAPVTITEPAKVVPTIQQAAATPPAEVIASADGSYIVAKGDTLYSISKKHNLTVDQLRALNGLPDNAISIGQVLKVK